VGRLAFSAKLRRIMTCKIGGRSRRVHEDDKQKPRGIPFLSVGSPEFLEGLRWGGITGGGWPLGWPGLASLAS
jgi:hypothetical protein